MIKFTNEIALITAVSDLRMFLDIVKGTALEFESISSRSEGEKSPSGPIRTDNVLVSLRTSDLRLSLEFTSANNNFVDPSKLFKNDFLKGYDDQRITNFRSSY